MTRFLYDTLQSDTNNVCVLYDSVNQMREKKTKTVKREAETQTSDRQQKELPAVHLTASGLREQSTRRNTRHFFAQCENSFYDNEDKGSHCSREFSLCHLQFLYLFLNILSRSLSALSNFNDSKEK